MQGKEYRLAFMLFCCCWVAISPNLYSQIPYRNFVFGLDGDLSEWPSGNEIAFSTLPAHSPFSNTCAVRLAWDEHSLFLAIAVSDQQLVTLERDSSRLYLNDAVELYVDPQNDSHERMDINDYQFIVDWEGRSDILKGDRGLIEEAENRAPKQRGIATLAYHVAVQQVGNAYSVEMELPFAGMGLDPAEGKQIKLEVCVDDPDSLVDIAQLPPDQEIPNYSASSWAGRTDFSFPQYWRVFRLEGGPDFSQVVSRKLEPYWLSIFASALLLIITLYIWFRYRIRQLKDVLPRAQISTQLLESFTPDPPNANDQIQPSSEPEPQAMEFSPAIGKCREYVEEHWADEIRVEDLARHCAMSERSLQRLFSEEMKLSPGNFVTLLKMERAAELLSARKETVSEVAWQLGFQDSSYFSRVFKKYHGKSPTEFISLQNR